MFISSLSLIVASLAPGQSYNCPSASGKIMQKENGMHIKKSTLLLGW